jgi:diguanylate cyclase
LVVKKKRRDIGDLDLGLPEAPSFDDFDTPSFDAPAMPSVPDMGAPTPMASPEGSLEKLSSQVVSELIRDGVPPIPTNFQLYFDRLLEEQSQEVQEEMHSLMELEDSNNDEQAMALEQKVKSAFRSIKQLLQISSTLYKNMTLMSRILSKRQAELGGFKDPDLKQVVKALQGDVSKLGTILDKQIRNMKEQYQSTASVVQEIEQGSVFDQQFGVYNKRYLITKLGFEAKQVEQFNHKSSLVTVSLSNEMRDLVPSEKAVLLMEKTVARLLMKTSRRSDIVAHYSQGVFSMLLKHTDLINAERASKRLIDLVSSTNFFLGEKEVVLSVNIGIANIAATRSAEETLLAALEAMKQISLSKTDYVKIYENDNLQ